MSLRPVPDPSQPTDPERHADEGLPDGEAKRGEDLATARDLLARTIRFLTLCQEDPRAATASENPTELVEALEGLDLWTEESSPAPQAEVAPEPGQRRNSA